jgi:small subunit ribosomal protein S1
MVANQSDTSLDQIMPEVDEGWWAAVLADEDASDQSEKEIPLRADMPSGTITVDWQRVQEMYEQDEVVGLLVHGYNRGGLLVSDHGIQGFVPVSHLVDMPANISDDDRRKRLANYVGATLQLKVIECEPQQERIVLSERAALAGEGKRKLLFKSLKSGDVVSGVVTNVTDFGIFIDLGGVEGLIHVSELSWGRVQHPSDILQIGSRIQALVLQINEESSRVALSLKRLNANPWETLVRRYKPGDVIPATVTSIMRFGAFARLEEGVEGLIHISSISLPGNTRNLEDYLSIGDLIQVRILHIDPERRRLGLSLVNVE